MYKKSQIKSEEILKLYREGMLLNDISTATSSSTLTVKKVLLHFGIDYNSVKEQEYKEKLIKVIELYEQGKSQTYIEQTLCLTRKTIRQLIKSKDLNYRDKSEQWHIRYETEIDHDCFKELNPTSLYWIGMLYTDGHIEEKREASIDLVLHNDDINHLEKFKLFLKSNRLVKSCGKTNASRMRFNSKTIRDRLIELGFTHNKSCAITPHELLKESRDFWRGCVDGDGGIYLKNKDGGYNTNQLTLCGTMETIFDFIIFCSTQALVKNKYPSKSHGKNLYQVHYYGKDAVKIADLLYKDSEIYLERKYQVYLKMIENI